MSEKMREEFEEIINGAVVLVHPNGHYARVIIPPKSPAESPLTSDEELMLAMQSEIDVHIAAEKLALAKLRKAEKEIEALKAENAKMRYALEDCKKAIHRWKNFSPFPDRYTIESLEFQMSDAAKKAQEALA